MVVDAFALAGTMSIDLTKEPIGRDPSGAADYLRDAEIDELNRIVVMWLDFADDQARRRKQIFLKDWQDKLDAFLQFNDREVLANAGTIGKQQADALAEAEYEKFAARRRELLEAEGEGSNLSALEAFASTLPKKRNK